jgi:hypothetical protein
LEHLRYWITVYWIFTFSTSDPCRGDPPASPKSGSSRRPFPGLRPFKGGYQLRPSNPLVPRIMFPFPGACRRSGRPVLRLFSEGGSTGGQFFSKPLVNSAGWMHRVTSPEVNDPVELSRMTPFSLRTKIMFIRLMGRSRSPRPMSAAKDGFSEFTM